MIVMIKHIGIGRFWTILLNETHKSKIKENESVNPVHSITCKIDYKHELA